ncbi:hypothetical protein H8959_022758 [Pygathrix nigripes]
MGRGSAAIQPGRSRSCEPQPRGREAHSYGLETRESSGVPVPAAATAAAALASAGRRGASRTYPWAASHPPLGPGWTTLARHLPGGAGLEARHGVGGPGG